MRRGEKRADKISYEVSAGILAADETKNIKRATENTQNTRTVKEWVKCELIAKNPVS